VKKTILISKEKKVIKLSFTHIGFILMMAGITFGAPVINVSPVQETTGLTEIAGVNPGETVYVDLLAANLASATHLAGYGQITLTVNGSATFEANADFTYFSLWTDQSFGYRNQTLVSPTELLIAAGAGPSTSTYMPLDGVGLGHIGVQYTGPGEATITATPASVPNPYGSVMWYDLGQPGLGEVDTEATGGQLTINPGQGPGTISDLTIKKMTVKAGKIRDSQDTFLVLGSLVDSPADFTGADSISIRFGPENNPELFTQTIPFTDENLKLSTSKPSLAYKGTTGAITNLKVDLAKASFSVLAANINLSGLSSPVTLQILFGSYHGKITVAEDVINGSKKPVPIFLLSGDTDALRLDKVKLGKNADSLSASGGIALMTPVNLEAEAVTITWGQKSYLIPAGNFIKKGKGEKYVCKKFEVGDGSTIKGTFDFGSKSSFSLNVKKSAQPLDSTGTVTFELSFAGYAEMYDWIFPAP
jgi:hypothetical protein